MHEKLEKAKTHLKENKTTYLVGGACLLVGAGAMLAFGLGADVKVNPQIKQILSYKPQAHQTVVVMLEEKANLSKPVRIKGTDKIFGSQNEAARQLGIPASLLSGHLNGKFESANGYQLEWLPIVDSASQK